MTNLHKVSLAVVNQENSKAPGMRLDGSGFGANFSFCLGLGPWPTESEPHVARLDRGPFVDAGFK